MTCSATTDGAIHSRLLLLVAIICFPASDPLADVFDDIENYVNEYQKAAAFDGVVLIADNESIVWQKTFGYADYERMLPITANTRFRIDSLSQHVTKVAVGHLIVAGKLSLQTRLSDYFPDFPNAGRITMAHLLNGTAGVADTSTATWMDTSVPMPLNRIIAQLAEETPRFKPGLNRQASDGEYALLAGVIERASGGSFHAYINESITQNGYASVRIEIADNPEPGAALRYSPGPTYGVRVAANTHVAANRTGAGSVVASAEDTYRLFRDSYEGNLFDARTSAELFPIPLTRTLRQLGQSPGAVAELTMDFEGGLTVLTLSSNSARPSGFHDDIVTLYRGEAAHLGPPVVLAGNMLPTEERAALTGQFVTNRPSLTVSIEATSTGLVFVQGNTRTAFTRTTDGAFHLPLHDWLCDYSAYNTEFECRSRNLRTQTKHLFERR